MSYFLILLGWSPRGYGNAGIVAGTEVPHDGRVHGDTGKSTIRRCLEDYSLLMYLCNSIMPLPKTLPLPDRRVSLFVAQHFKPIGKVGESPPPLNLVSDLSQSHHEVQSINPQHQHLYQ